MNIVNMLNFIYVICTNFIIIYNWQNSIKFSVKKHNINLYTGSVRLLEFEYFF